MCTLEKFNILSVAPIPKRQIKLQMMDEAGKLSFGWQALSHLDMHEQYRQVKTLLSELIVADIQESLRLSALESLVVVVERLATQMQAEYVNNPQTSFSEQKIYADEVRSLYFLAILAYQAVAFGVHIRLNQNTPQKNNWLNKITGLQTANIGMTEDKKCYIISVYRIMSLCDKLLAEFALTYQKSPPSLWRVMNSWYLKSAMLGLDKLCVSKISELAIGSIHKQYLYGCVLSFVNLFAYRRADILNIYKILPEWAGYVEATFDVKKHHRIFVNLQGNTPPELVTPFASINPYSDEYVCLFFDVSALFERLNELEQDGQEWEGRNAFEGRLAKMVLLAFQKQLEQPISKTAGQSAHMIMGFGEIYKEIAGGRSFGQVIAQNTLTNEYRPKRVFGVKDNPKKQMVKVVQRSDSGAQFVIHDQIDSSEQILTRPYLPVFGLFAMKSPRSQSKHPWRLGIVHWAESKDDCVEVDGRFLGRILSVCGVRLSSHDMRSQDFVQAMLLAGDGLNQRTTLILPRYHFKVGDSVILRVGEKQSTLRLEQNLLSTDDIEQYEIVRLVS